MFIIKTTHCKLVLYPKTLMLVSNTDTTTSLSKRTSLTAFFTASSNSSSLFSTCAHATKRKQLHFQKGGRRNKFILGLVNR